jgi:chemotaxis protein histidine kinase CheA
MADRDDRDPVLARILRTFIGEARDICARITKCVLDLEQPQPPAERKALYEELARGLHTLKGNSDSLGLPDIADLAHRMEDVVGPMRRADVAIEHEVADVLLKGIDRLLQRLAIHIEKGGDGLGDLADTHAMLAAAAAQVKALRPAAPQTAPPPRARAKGVTLTPLTAGEAAAVLDAAPTPSAIAPPTPRTDETPDLGVEEGWRISMRNVVALMRDVERLRELRLRIDERRRELARLVGDAGAPNADPRELRLRLRAVERALATDSEETTELVSWFEDEVKTIAALPLRSILEPMHRAVRDLCRQLGKEARLSIVGGELSLDRRLLEALQPPLIHLVRNAVDHGIEKPADRVAQSKHREGAINIRVEQVGNILTIEVEDDGKGLDPARIREVAAQRGVHTEDELAAMSTRELYDLLFRSGFSTRGEVTEISGRGIGLDVVRNKVEAAQGHVEVVSVPGQGTRFVITVPAELGSSPVIVVRVGEQDVGVPMMAVETIRAFRKEDAMLGSAGRGTARLEHQGGMLAVQDLGAILALRQPRRPVAGRPILIMQNRGQRLALAVDALVGDREVVIRRLPAELADLAPYQGAATLAKGDLLLVLRAEWLIEQDKAEAPRETTRALVVDDSLTARALHRTILEAGGFRVHTASSGVQALEQLENAAYDVVICDIEMEPMDGIALVGRLRAQAATRLLPVILVSAHDTEDERGRGEVAGADAFVSKKDCVAGRLLDEVAKVMARRRGAS